MQCEKEAEPAYLFQVAPERVLVHVPTYQACQAVSCSIVVKVGIHVQGLSLGPLLTLHVHMAWVGVHCALHMSKCDRGH